jgi:hypothetical protein
VKTPASFRGNFHSLFTAKNEAIRRQFPAPALRFENAATEGIDFSKSLGIDQELAFSGMMGLEEIDQVPGRTGVKIAGKDEVRISIDPL